MHCTFSRVREERWISGGWVGEIIALAILACSENGFRCGSHSSLMRNVLVASGKPRLLRLRHDWSSRIQRKGGPMPLRSAKFWSNRAERARKIAEQMDELDARLAILEMARHYEILAENSPIVEALDKAATGGRERAEVTFVGRRTGPSRAAPDINEHYAHHASITTSCSPFASRCARQSKLLAIMKAGRSTSPLVP